MHTISPTKIHLDYNIKINRLIIIKDKNIISSIYHKIYKGKTTSVRTPYYSLIQTKYFTNDISFIYEPPITRCLFLVLLGHILLEDGPFGKKNM
jgi:hypothetical protein